MKKLLTLFTALIVMGGMTIAKADYFVAHNQVLNDKYWTVDGDQMTQVGMSNIYSITFNGVGTSQVQFKVTDGSWDAGHNWGGGNINQSPSNVNLSDDGGNVAFTLPASDDVTIYFDAEHSKIYVHAASIPTYIFPAGTDIYYDLTGYGDGVDDKDGTWHGSTSEIFSITLSGDWAVTASTKLFRSGPGGNWGDRTCSTLPTAGQNMIVSTNGIDCQWDTYTPVIPTVEFVSLQNTTLIGSTITFEAQTYEITNPIVSFYVKADGGSYGSAVTSYTFNELGKFVVKAEAIGDGMVEPVSCEKEVEVYTTHTFTSGTTIYVDFSAMTEGAKGVNYPKVNEAGLDYEAEGAGAIRAVIFSQDVEWSTTQDFIKTEKNNWTGLKFSVPAAGQDLIVVAADGASYTWSTFVPSTYYLKNKWTDCENWSWKEMTAVGDGTFRLEEVVYGGVGINYNFLPVDEGAHWKEASKIKYLDGATPKVVALFDTINLVLDPAQDTIWAEMVHKDVTVYTVASNSLALCDLGWAPTHPYKYTDMKKQTDGTYMWNHEDAKVILPAGEVELKVVKNRSYDNGCWPEIENFKYDIKRGGEYEITIHFNACTKDIWIDTTCVKPLNIQIPLYIKGSWNNWSATPMLQGGYNDKAIVTLSLTEGTYEFKLEDVQDKWYGDGQAYTRDNNSHKDIESKEESATTAMTLEVDKAGDYLFTYFYDGELLLVQYPAIVPTERIAPLSGKFTINSKGDTAVFSRGNLHYNYESDAWYAAEKQYDALGDLNLRFGDATYTGSIDLFGWSCTSSDFGKQWKYKDEEFSGDFVDWGTLFAGGEKEWSTLSKDEWKHLLARKKGNNPLWTILEIGPDSLSGLVLFPDNWEAPASLTKPINYGFYDLENEAGLRANAFSYAEWEAMETAGAAFLPLAGQRAGYYGNTWSGTAVSSLSNPLALGYDWVDDANGMSYYWTSTPGDAIRAYCYALPGFNATSWLAPMPLNRERRRGHPVRLVTRIPKVPDYTRDVAIGVIGTLCVDHNVPSLESAGASFYQIAGKTEAGNIVFDEVTSLNAGEPYIYQATASTMGVYYGSTSVASPVPVKGMYGSFEDFNLAIDEGNKLNILYIAGNKIHDCSDIATLQVVANRCYIKLDEVPAASPNAAPGRRRITLGRDEATGLFDLNTSDAPRKLLINGTIYILRGENVYDATGRLVK